MSASNVYGKILAELARELLERYEVSEQYVISDTTCDNGELNEFVKLTSKRIDYLESML